MPWKTMGAMDQKIRLMADWQTEHFSITDLSQKYGLSRPTIYKWLERYEEFGIDGLRDQKRTPLYRPNQTRDDIIELIVKEKLKNFNRGPRKIYYQLKKQYPNIDLPVPSTIGGWLKKLNMVNIRKKRLRVAPYTEPFVECKKPNAVWSADYKGQFYTKDNRVCYPLTVSDNYSRYLIKCQGLPGPRYNETKAVFETAFKEYGLPDAIRSDNGVPFAGKSVGGLSRLSVWWIQLGIIPERIDKGCPEQNGRHERMHRTLKLEAVNPVSSNMIKQQIRFDRFRADYNYCRPHEALGQSTPSSYYKKSMKMYRENPKIPDYDFQYKVRSINSGGAFKFKNKEYYLSELLAKEPVGLKEVDDGMWHIYYGFCMIAMLDLKAEKIIR
jgi:transposase InsO family protein